MSLVCLSMAAILSTSQLSWPPGALGVPLMFTEEPMIVSQDLISGVCTDSTGIERGDLEEWTSTPGACDKVVCHVEPSGNYTVTHNCRPTEPNENPDTTNCVWQTDSTAAYPDCCPQLSCAAASLLSTIDPLSCYDLASHWACSVWYNLTVGCTDAGHTAYNYTQTFCRKTCSLC